jgi:voltage-gated potassium channel
VLPIGQVVLRNRYNILLGILILHLTGLALDLPVPWTDLINLALAPVAAFLLRTITGRGRDGWILLALGLSGSLLNLALPWGAGPLALDLLKVALWTLAPAYLAARVFVTIYDTDAITHAEIAGAVAVYLLLALIFANVFEALYHFDHQHIQFGDNFDASGVGFGEVLYFSFVTLSSLGYGDVSPATSVTRTVAVVESVMGLMYMAILVARFVSLHSAHRYERRRSPRD